MADFWDAQISRADDLAAEPTGSQELLTFYAQLLRVQRQIHQALRSDSNWIPAADLRSDLPKLLSASRPLFEVVVLRGPATLASEAQVLLKADREIIEKLLIDYWHNPTDIQFFAKAILQPYAHWLVESGMTVKGRELAGGEHNCPYFGGQPQLSYLQNKEITAESGNRYLVCATCLHSWEFRRAVCAHCGEDRPSKLGYFHSPEFDYIRIEACDSCQRYLKGIDLTRNGLAVPLVDEIYAAALDLWAREHGYVKIELNLLGV